MTEFPLISGKVIHGDKVGRTIGFPTANLDVDLTPKELQPGVYFGTCELNGQTYDCLPYFGPRLIFGELKNSFEVYIYNFDQEIYDQELSVTIKTFLRAPEKVNNLDELKAKLELDKAEGLKHMHDRFTNKG